MTTIDQTGHACVGDLRLSARDVGVDLRVTGDAVALPDEFASVGLDRDGRTDLITGTRAEMIAAIRAAGYVIAEERRRVPAADVRTTLAALRREDA